MDLLSGLFRFSRTSENSGKRLREETRNLLTLLFNSCLMILINFFAARKNCWYPKFTVQKGMFIRQDGTYRNESRFASGELDFLRQKCWPCRLFA